MQTTLPSLKDKWIHFRLENPKTRIRDAAAKMGTTEAEILAAFAGSSVLRLTNGFGALLNRMPALGYVMCLTRNEYCVHERKGVFEGVSVSNPHIGLVVGPDIDLRLFFRSWAFVFAVLENEEAGFKPSIQVFDHQGLAVLKVYLTESSDREAFEKLVRDFQDPVQAGQLSLQPASAPPAYNDAGVDENAFRADWGALQDTHDFFPLLKKHQVSRLHALRIAGAFARPVANDTVKDLLQAASAAGWEIMVFVSNHGSIQIHTGKVQKIVEIPGWINVMDPAFNLHCRLDGIAETWAVQKPTADGPVHSIEVYDRQGELIVQFFGKRKPGQRELTDWTGYVQGLMKAERL